MDDGRIRLTCRPLATAACVLAVVICTNATAGDWPHWRGPHRNGVSDETSGWNGGRWIDDKAAWSTNAGVGSTSPIVVGGRVYVTGWSDKGTDVVRCLDAVDGKPLWSQSYKSPKYGRFAIGDKSLYGGPTGTPEFDAESSLLFTLGTDGDLNCWDAAKNGKPVWRVNLYDAFQVPQRKKLTRYGHRDYGYTSAPYVYGAWVIVEVGDDEGCLIAFNKRTGKKAWTSESRDPAGHAGGPVPLTVDGVPCLTVLTQKNLLVVRLDKGREGETVAEHPWITDYANSIAAPGASGSDVLVTSNYNKNAMCRLSISLSGAKKVWEKPHVSKVCSPVIDGGRIYWVWRQTNCVDIESGRQLWKSRADHGDPGSCILTSDKRLITWTKNGRLVLAETAERSPDAYKELFRRDRMMKDDAWPHVVLANGRLYLKDRSGRFECYTVPGKGE